ncbi:MAG TPA: hypothetical protein VNW98_02990 [Burkholderiaceae bacterium]|nr:hypothetical protein [Burkholderiaceae bacterium]
MASQAAIRLITGVWLIAALAPARADQWSVEKAGFNLYQIAGRRLFIRTEGCDDAPAKGVVNIQKEGATRRMTFGDSAASCTVRDFLAPVEVQWSQYSVLLTRDQTSNWYRVTDSDMYLKTVGCISRGISEPAVLDLNRDGTGWVRFMDGRRCGVEHAFRRFNP